MTPRMLLTAALTVFVGVALVTADQVTVADNPYHRYEWRANTFRPGAQHEAALTVDCDGQIVGVWSSRRQNEGRAGVYAQRFDALGVARGSETSLALWSKSHQTLPAIAADSAGNTWVVWQAFGQDGYAGAIIARRFGAGFTGGSEIAVNQQVAGHQDQPQIAAARAGNVMIVWTSQSGPKEPQRLRGRVFAPDGQPVGDEFAISTTAGQIETTPGVAAGRDGSFAVVYSVFDEKLDPRGIRLQRFDARGQRLGEELNVSGPARNSQIEPVVAATPEGYIVAWLDAESDGDEYGVLARRLGLAGEPLCEPFIVNTTRQGCQNAAAVAVASDGSFAIAWNSDDADKTGVFGQLFAADGTRRGGEFRLSSATRGKQALQPATGTQRLAFGPQGELVCIWSGDAGLGDDASVNVTMLSPRPLQLAGRQQGVTDDMPVAAVPAAVLAAEPHIPPTFDANLIDYSEREIRREGRFGFTAITSTGWTPPDPHMAIGPYNMVAIVNGGIAGFDRSGNKLFQYPIEGSGGFWGSVGATDFVFDPEVLYDELSGRFFAMAAEGYAPGNRSYALVAVSDDSDAVGTWYKYRFETTALAGNLLDSPNIGVDNDVVYITGDGFGLSANYPVYTFDKASLLAGLPPAIQKSTTLTTSTQSAGIPPVSFDNPPAYYMIEHQEGSNKTGVRLIALRNPLTAPTFTDYVLTVSPYSAPGDPPQKGTSVKPETFDARFWSVAYRNGSLWATHHINTNPVTARWYQIAMKGWPTSGQNPQLVQWGNIAPGTGIHTFFTSIHVNARGDAAICCARSSTDEYISMITTYRWANDPLNTFKPVTIEKASTGPYGQARWGDYSAVVPDPTNIMWFWAHHEYAEGSVWKTWIAQVALPFITGDMNCDGVVNFSDINPFVQALSDPAGYQAQFPYCNLNNGDINGDQQVNFSDINPFVALLGS